MKSLIKQSINIALTFLSLLLLSCATTGQFQRYTQGSVIDSGFCSITGPPGDGWFVSIQKDLSGTIDFQKRHVSQSTGLVDEYTSIRVFRNWITDEKLRRLSEEEVADDFRRMEEVGMWKMGVMRGQYLLTDVKKDTTTIGDKKIYFMSYKTSHLSQGPTRQKVIADSVLYLFFPDDFKESHFFYCFLMAHSFIEGTLEKGDLTPVIPVINSLKIK
jgi:hypothetical protein